VRRHAAYLVQDPTPRVLDDESAPDRLGEVDGVRACLLPVVEAGEEAAVVVRTVHERSSEAHLPGDDDLHD
jgi:hypothetical protein